MALVLISPITLALPGISGEWDMRAASWLNGLPLHGVALGIE
jgi:hypothetical protein